MARYIDADELIVIGLDGPDCEHQFKFVPWEFIEDAPTADVVEVVRGEWKGKPIAGNCTVRCSVCGSAFLENDGRWNYCPNCGARMVSE